MRLILLGPPGSGKGTQGDLIEDKFGFPKISAGDLLRSAVKQGTASGLKAKKSIDKGELVEDYIILEMIKDRIGKDDCRNGYTLDGFPRNVSQAELLEEIGPEKEETAIDIRIDDETVVRRLSSRYICSECNNIYNIKNAAPTDEKKCGRCGGKLVQREDDSPEVIKKRLSVYHNETEKLVRYYNKKGIYKAVDGEGRIEEVFQRICSLINKIYMQSKECEV